MSSPRTRSLKRSICNLTNWMAPSWSAASQVTLEVSPGGSRAGIPRRPKGRMGTSHLLGGPSLLSQQMPQQHRLQNPRGIPRQVGLPELSLPDGSASDGSPLLSSFQVHGAPASHPPPPPMSLRSETHPRRSLKERLLMEC